MNQLDMLGVDINYGVVSYMDYPKTYNSYGYYAVYGYASAGDYAYKMNQAVTGDRAAVASSINGLVLGHGGDGPQDYTRIFHESYADPSISWRPGAKKIFVNFGDNVPHDNNLNEGVMSGTWSTGGDPGRDEIMLTSDDLDLQAVLARMADSNVTLLECHTTDYAKTHWDYWTGITGGKTYITGSSTLVSDLTAAVTAALTTPTVENLRLKASPGFESWIESVDPASYSGRTGTTAVFSLKIKVPEGSPDGTYNFTVEAVDNAGVNYGSQNVRIKVISSIKVGIDIKPGSYPNSINLKNKGNVPVAVLSSSTFDATKIDRNSVVFAGASPLPIGASPEDVNKDGLPDVVLRFATQDLNLIENDTQASLSGKTLDGRNFVGSDSVRIIKK
ncbi:MAG: hypothetical protein ACOY30_07410 [Bacillota bacterium]